MSSKKNGFLENFKSINVATSLTLMATVPMLVVAVLMVAFFYSSSFTSIRNSYEKQLLSTATGVAEDISKSSTSSNTKVLSLEGDNLLINGKDASYIDRVFDSVEDGTGTVMALYFDRNAYYSNITDDLGSLSMDDTVYSVVINGSTKYLKYNSLFDGKFYVAAYAPVIVNSKAVGAVMAAVPAHELTKQAKRAILLSFVLVVIIVAALLFISLRFSKGLIKVIDQIGTASKALSVGDLSKERTEEEKAAFKEASERQDEFGELVRNTEAVSDKLRATVLSIKNQAEKVATASGRLSELTTSVAGMSESVTENVSEISSGAVEQASEVQKAANDVSNISERLDSIMEHIKKVQEKLDELKAEIKNNDQNNASMDDILRSLHETRESFKKTRADCLDVSNRCRSLNDSISNLSAISEEYAASTQEASDSVENINENILEVNELSMALKDVSDTLSETLAYYKLESKKDESEHKETNDDPKNSEVVEESNADNAEGKVDSENVEESNPDNTEGKDDSAESSESDKD